MKGFTLFFAVLVASLALSIGIAIYDITVRELSLSATVTQSQYSIYAADTGAECALYWDAKCTAGSCSGGSAFATSTTYTGATSGAGLNCNSIDITANTTPAPDWTVSSAANAATTTFTINFTPLPYCATVTVAKVGNPPTTVITSHGYNTCANNGALQIERVLQVNY
ncbi:MAG: hypothetical protein KGH79_01380 [Patescibacteria group bacterium]|nr:hypothetical protein [Patescibacteria group bacterium]